MYYSSKFLTYLMFVLSISQTNCFARTDSLNLKSNLFKGVESFINKYSNTTGLVVLHQGKTIFEYGDPTKISYIASCRKSILSMLYGKFISDGRIKLNTTIGEIGINEIDGLLPRELNATIENIITSRSGVFHVASNSGYDKKNFLPRGSVDPGEYFVYNNWDFNVGGYIIEHYSNKSIYKLFEEEIAIPLKFDDWDIQNQKKSGNSKKSKYLAYHFYMSTRDMSKIGQLMLNKGNWNGNQIIPTSWVNKSLETVTPNETLVERYGPSDPDGIKMSYGYMWWLIDDYKNKDEYKGAYSAIGYGGQYITVFPKLDLVIAHKTKLNLLTFLGIKKDGDKYYWDIVHSIVEIIKDNLN